ncbi:gamma-glutamyl-gamma-aminobutyrate hydrolase family protein [Oceanobacillus halophilus]|uniref:Gamma-glutamyl-gamma-aminobutyrate hydrolase family protein n=1 Tax=Oceanobacillus halophilus TaxID=930130 RepID=A0A495A7Z5_9BACI|nr:gamma-glutamyl-gamma-aminobutyrate hydrolase family protein [Oceanobacillus halophilus]RKQ34595.1 gamma-glutamyl-gamma-aminobutyrate hydrolase family protein [Oceanobacillus halophilus]
MKPFIGVTSSMEIDQSHYAVNTSNIKAIIRAGGMPVMLPYTLEDEDLHQLANQLDGLYATGGYDIDPTLFDEEPHPQLGTIIPARDHFEIELMKRMLELDKPILGVCRGSQTLNIAGGGDMYQDIYAQIDTELLQHAQKAPREHASHFVDVLENSLLHQLTGKRRLRVNSYHHQANRGVTEPFQVSGLASDGIIEAVESKGHRFVLGVQWHPEAMVDESSQKIYAGFMKACKKDLA